jgi:hypothetical protein
MSEATGKFSGTFALILRKTMNRKSSPKRVIHCAWVLLLLVACAAPARPWLRPTPTPAIATRTPAHLPSPTAEPSAAHFSPEQMASLRSLEQVDDYPLYTMHYHGAFETTSLPPTPADRSAPAWACSLFAALGDPAATLYGRNFDWRYSPALLLFTDPPDAYASVSMVDIAYLFDAETAKNLTDLPPSERAPLLNAPFMPFDGMNEHGLVVGMAAVPPGRVPEDPAKETVDSLLAIRRMLDGARTVEEAVALLGSYNVRWGGGPALHYLVADPSGRAALVEFYQGQMMVLPNGGAWHGATNFLRSAAGDNAQGKCARYDTIHRRLAETEGQLDTRSAFDLLAQVAQGGGGSSTQWSVIYEMTARRISVAMGRKYEQVHTFEWHPTEE